MSDTKPVPVRLDPTTIAALDARAAREGVSRSVLMVRFIEQGLNGGDGIGVEAPAPKPSPAPKVERKPAQAAPPAPAPKVERARQAMAEAEAGAAHKGLGYDRAGVKAAIHGMHLPPPDRPAPGSRLKRSKPGRGF